MAGAERVEGGGRRAGGRGLEISKEGGMCGDGDGDGDGGNELLVEQAGCEGEGVGIRSDWCR